jgi:hypothetical protein
MGRSHSNQYSITYITRYSTLISDHKFSTILYDYGLTLDAIIDIHEKFYNDSRYSYKSIKLWNWQLSEDCIDLVNKPRWSVLDCQLPIQCDILIEKVLKYYWFSEKMICIGVRKYRKDYKDLGYLSAHIPIKRYNTYTLTANSKHTMYITFLTVPYYNMNGKYCLFRYECIDSKFSFENGNGFVNDNQVCVNKFEDGVQELYCENCVDTYRQFIQTFSSYIKIEFVHSKTYKYPRILREIGEYLSNTNITCDIAKLDLTFSKYFTDDCNFSIADVVSYKKLCYNTTDKSTNVVYYIFRSLLRVIVDTVYNVCKELYYIVVSELLYYRPLILDYSEYILYKTYCFEIIITGLCVYWRFKSILSAIIYIIIILYIIYIFK